MGGTTERQEPVGNSRQAAYFAARAIDSERSLRIISCPSVQCRYAGSKVPLRASWWAACIPAGEPGSRHITTPPVGVVRGHTQRRLLPPVGRALSRGQAFALRVSDLHLRAIRRGICRGSPIACRRYPMRSDQRFQTSHL
jgi:hypothetical protein